MRVLFIGGSGVISSACSRAGRRARHRAVRAQPRAQHQPGRCRPRRTVLRGDVRDPAAVRGRRWAAASSTPWWTGSPSRPSTCAGRPRPVPRPDRAVRVHQLGVGLPDPAGPAAGDGVDAAAQPVLAVLPRQDRLRGPARRGLPRRGLPGDDRAAVAHLRQDPHPLRRRLDRPGPDAPGQAGRRARRRHLAVDADPSRGLRPGLRAAARPPPHDRRGVPHHLRRRAHLEPDRRSAGRGGRGAAPTSCTCPRTPSRPPTRTGAPACSATRRTRWCSTTPSCAAWCRTTGRSSRSSRAPGRSSPGTTRTRRGSRSTPALDALMDKLIAGDRPWPWPLPPSPRPGAARPSPARRW